MSCKSIVPLQLYGEGSKAGDISVHYILRVMVRYGSLYFSLFKLVSLWLGTESIFRYRKLLESNYTKLKVSGT